MEWLQLLIAVFYSKDRYGRERVLFFFSKHYTFEMDNLKRQLKMKRKMNYIRYINPRTVFASFTEMLFRNRIHFRAGVGF